MRHATRGRVALAPDAYLAPFEFIRRDLRSDEVAIDIRYRGLS